MVTIGNLETNAPQIIEDLTLGILSCTVNIEGAIKTYYFQHVKGGLIVNNELADLLQNTFKQARIQEGDNGISTYIDSFIPSEIMDSSLIGIRQVGIDYIDSTKRTISIEKIAMKTKLPQALLYYMLDSVMTEYKKDGNILGIKISKEVIMDAKENGYFQNMQKFIDSRGLKENLTDGELDGYSHEDKIAMKLAELRKQANVIEGSVSNVQRRLYLEQFGNNIHPFARKANESTTETVSPEIKTKMR